MRIGIAQINTTPGAFEQTVGRMVAQSQRAAEQGVELLVFPLAALAGVDVVPYADRLSFMIDVAEAVAQLCERLECPAIVPVPMDFDAQPDCFDALLIDAGEVRPLRMFARVWPSQAQREDATGLPVQFDFGGMSFGLALSYADLDGFDDRAHHVDTILFLSGYPYALDDSSSAMGADLDSSRYVEDARAANSWLIGAASVGGYGDQVFSGSSMVLAPSGELAALAPAFEEALLVADIAVPFEGYLEEPVESELYDAPFALWQAIMLGLHDYVLDHGYTDVALCLDGSLGASVLAALATDALGPLHVHAVVGASAGSHAAACRDLAHRLRIDVLNAAGRFPDYDPRDVDELELAALARTHHALALSSLDKTALALGVRASSLQAAALYPLGDVYRSDVLDMAHVRNSISPLFRRVDLTEVDAVPVCFPDGTQKLLSSEADITDLDETLLNYVEYERSLAELVAEEPYDKDLIDAILRMVHNAEPLRRSAAPVLVMSTHTLDDVCFPLGMRWHDKHSENVFDAYKPFAFGEEPLRKPEAPTPKARSTQRMGMDLDATLAMLRDLWEQGGLGPLNLTALTGDAMGAGPLPDTPGAPGWIAPFSEN